MNNSGTTTNYDTAYPYQMILKHLNKVQQFAQWVL
jgi:hypothetical protein